MHSNTMQRYIYIYIYIYIDKFKGYDEKKGNDIHLKNNYLAGEPINHSLNMIDFE